MINDEILTLAETAEYLKVAEKTIQRMITANKIPCTRVGNQWRFIKCVLDDWLMESMNEGSKIKDPTTLPSDENIPLSRLLIEVITPLKEGSKREILAQLAAPLFDKGLVTNQEGYLNKLEDRENMISTAIGEGIAIPHIRNPKENDQGKSHLVIGLSPQGIEYNAIDNLPVNIFFLVHTGSEVTHLKILSKVTNLVKDTGIEEFLICTNKREIETLLLQKETGLR